MDSTPHEPEPGTRTPSADDRNRPTERAGYWRSEYLPDGTERYWSTLARHCTERDEDRATVAAALDAITWYRHKASVPFSAGASLNEIIRQLPPPPIAAGISEPPITLPESGLSECDRALYLRDPALLDSDLIQTTSVVALAFRESNAVFLMYYLDEGIQARPVALDIRDMDTAPGRSIGCGAGLHQICRGRYITEDRETRPCQCHCGCEQPESALRHD